MKCISHSYPSQLVINRRCHAVQSLEADQRVVSVTTAVRAPSAGSEQVGGHEEDKVWGPPHCGQPWDRNSHLWLEPAGAWNARSKTPSYRKTCCGSHITNLSVLLFLEVKETLTRKLIHPSMLTPSIADTNYIVLKLYWYSLSIAKVLLHFLMSHKVFRLSPAFRQTATKSSRYAFQDKSQWNTYYILSGLFLWQQICKFSTLTNEIYTHFNHS